MQAEFTQYVRMSTRKVSTVVLVLVLIICVFMAFQSKMAKEERDRQIMFQTTLTVGPPVLLSGLALLISYKKIVFVELVAPLMLSGYYLMVLLINTTELTENVNNLSRQYQMNFMLAIHTVFTLFTSSTWCIGFLLRFPLFMVASYWGMSNRVQ